MRIWLPTIKAGSGSDVFSERLAAGLNAAGHDAHITWFPQSLEVVPTLLRASLPPKGTEIIHANSAYAFAFKRPGTALVATELHHLLDPSFRPYKSLFQHAYQKHLISKFLYKSYACADAITAISEFTAGVLAKEAGVAVSAVIPLWVNTGVFKPNSERHVRTDRVFKLLFIGNASKRKGADIVPALAAKLGATFEIRCTAGLRQQLKSENIENVKILGRLSEQDLVREYQECDAVLVPSRYEGFGYAALEAMACAKPVVGFRSGAVAEVVGTGGSSLLVEIDDLDGLAEVCRRLESDPRIGLTAGAEGLQRCCEIYAESNAIGSYIKLYTQLVRANGRG